MKKILFVCLHRPDRSPSQRFRFEQYLPFLEEQGFDCHFSWLLNEKDDKIFYSPGEYFKKAGIVWKSVKKRFKEIRKAEEYSIVFIQRECFMLGTSFFERKFSQKSKIIFDFDDSIWVNNVSDSNKNLAFLKNANKTREIIKFASLVFAGNNYLADFARQYNSNVVIIPTTIDTDIYKPKPKAKRDKVCIGWSGSVTTIEHLETGIAALEKIYNEFRDKVYFKIIGDDKYYNEKLNVKGLPWKMKTEVEDMQEFDIGIMPLPDTEWAKGKCGLKGLQYMALEIPTIMSPVGVNVEIINDGVNGFLASDEDTWSNKISNLIKSKELREELGQAGRRTVLDKYSVEANKNKYLMHFNSLLN